MEYRFHTIEVSNGEQLTILRRSPSCVKVVTKKSTCTACYPCKKGIIVHL